MACGSDEKGAKTAVSFLVFRDRGYTVGWKMSVVIEKEFGRARLIECFCDQPKLLATYNDAAAKYNQGSTKPVALWSKSLVDALQRTGGHGGPPLQL